MTLRLTLLCALATAGTAVAQPKKADPKAPAPTAPATAPTTPAPAPTPSEDETPPKDREGRDENPGNPNSANTADPTKVVAVVPPKRTGYPTEEALRPINLPAAMSEVSIAPHIQVSPYQGSDALRARYGITRQVQLGFTYMLAGIFNEHDYDSMLEDKLKIHSGKAIGLDVTVLVKDWIGVRVGVPVYLKPVAVSLTLGAPMKFQIGDKFAVGGLDDLLNIKLKRFPPSFYFESLNFDGDVRNRTNSTQSRGILRFSGFGIYQHNPKLAFIGRTGIEVDNFETIKQSNGGLKYFIRAGLQFTPKKFLDLGLSIGFDDLAENGTFGPAGFLAFRI